jgi:hypothetical protein
VINFYLRHEQLIIITAGILAMLALGALVGWALGG